MAVHEVQLLDLYDRTDGILQESTPLDEVFVSLLVKKDLPNLNITRVCEVKNSFLKYMYDLTKEEYKSRYGRVTETRLFHATSEFNVNPIIQNNLDWRRVSRSKFGMGVSFSNDADYANFFSNSSNGNVE
uniref:Poly [ADP-ribose] polymerase n=1 Tax=Graphocephala atropunctata TaxID=36148 RepID=A0A1B6LVC8_9HEMI